MIAQNLDSVKNYFDGRHIYMRYIEPIYRPGPTEWNSYLLQVTYGCAHNKCTFCSFFKDKPFGIRPFKEIEEDLAMARQYYDYDPPVFLIDGDASCYSMDKLRPILQAVHKTFLDSPHTNMYARFGDIYKNYSVDNLKEMKEYNVKVLNIGLESGSDKVLSDIKKGNTQAEIIEASRRLNEAGLPFTTGMILGLGGLEDSDEHVRETIKVLNMIQPSAVGLMALNPQTGTPLYDDIVNGKFELPTYRDILREEREILEGLEFDRPSEIWSGGFLPGNEMVRGTIPQEKDKILKALSHRKITNQILDRKIMMNGSL